MAWSALDVAFALVLGANLGSAVTPLLATAGPDPEGRRVPLGNAIFRVVGVAIALPLLGTVTPYLARIESEPWRQVADFHTAFNLALAIVFIGLTGPVAKLCTRLQPDRPRGADEGKPRYLDPRRDGIARRRHRQWGARDPAHGRRRCQDAGAARSTSSAMTIASCSARSKKSTMTSTRCTRRSSSI